MVLFNMKSLLPLVIASTVLCAPYPRNLAQDEATLSVSESGGSSALDAQETEEAVSLSTPNAKGSTVLAARETEEPIALSAPEAERHVVLSKRAPAYTFTYKGVTYEIGTTAQGAARFGASYTHPRTGERVQGEYRMGDRTNSMAATYSDRRGNGFGGGYERGSNGDRNYAALARDRDTTVGGVARQGTNRESYSGSYQSSTARGHYEYWTEGGRSYRQWVWDS